jgi:hypothetical protein
MNTALKERSELEQALTDAEARFAAANPKSRARHCFMRPFHSPSRAAKVAASPTSMGMSI